ncbi:hypothetical protein AURDEDRAFT_117344 [Auricularia subglabra TFB-10046 SS5]|nr:hypothetical protein AURDEDRAFT_117344 [Auricularia subglabra TFB-10046 SS5]
MASFFDAVSSTVRILQIHQPLKQEHLPLVRRLKNVEQLRLARQHIDNAAFDELASSAPPVWPRLSAIEQLGYANGSDGARILRFIAARNASTEPEEPGYSSVARPCRLRDFHLFTGWGVTEVPGWLMQEIERLMCL